MECADRRAQILCETNALRKAVWRLQDTLGEARYPTSYSDRRPHASQAYRKWVRKLWRKRHARLRKDYDSGWGVVNRAWPQADEWTRIAVCESGHNPPDWQHNSGTYQGGLGFYHGSWDAFRPAGFPSEAYLASPLQQMIVAERIFDRYALTGWGCRGAA